MRKRKKIFTIVNLLIALTLCMGCGSLSTSAIKGDLNDIKSRIEAGGKINEIDKWGWTPLLWATYNSHYTIVEYLLENGADPNLKSQREYWAVAKGSTPLIIAARIGNSRITRLLLKYGADKNIANSLGQTPQSLADDYSFMEVIDELNKSVSIEKPIIRQK